MARTGAVMAVLLASRMGRRLAGGSVVAGALAAAGVALCGEYFAYATFGVVTGLVPALALGGVEAWRAGRRRAALACGVGCALLQVESWPFLIAAGVVLWRQRPQDRALLAGCAVAVPALWFVPELFGSGDLLRSAERARIPNPGQPALADVPALDSLREAALLPLWPLWVGVIALVPIAVRGGSSARAPIALAAVGLAWMTIVAAMAQAGFSGEPRYALPGAALVAVSGAVGLVTVVPRSAYTLGAAALVGLLAVVAPPRLAGPTVAAPKAGLPVGAGQRSGGRRAGGRWARRRAGLRAALCRAAARALDGLPAGGGQAPGRTRSPSAVPGRDLPLAADRCQRHICTGRAAGVQRGRSCRALAGARSLRAFKYISVSRPCTSVAVSC